MEIIFWIISLLVAFVILNNIFSSQETKLFRTMWSAERRGQHLVQYQAFKKLLEISDIKISPSEKDVSSLLGDKVAGLIEKAMTFDIKYKNNLGILITPLVADYLKNAFNDADIYDFDEILIGVCTINPIEMHKIIQKAIQKPPSGDTG